jgi:glucokinase
MKAIGVDLGGTNARIALVDTTAETPVADEQKWQHGAQTPEAIADAIAGAAARLAGPEIPLGIGLAGMIARGTGVVKNAPNLGWRDVDFGALLAARLPGRRIKMVNDVGAIALGEGRWGAARGADSALCVFTGTGIGAGILVGGWLHEGHSGVAAELGHTRVVIGPTARPCGCGARGCIEAYAGGRLLSERVRADLAAGTTSKIPAIAAGQEVHAGHVDQAARQGDAYALRLWDEISPLFGLALANAVTLLDPQRLVLGGTVLWGAPLLREKVLAAYAELANAPARDGCQVIAAHLGDSAGLYGAAIAATASG